MPRPRSTIPTVRKELWLPADLVARVDLLLFSDAEGRVPYRAWSRLIEPMLRNLLEKGNPNA